jgi:paraquat-inducible protein B
MKKETSTKTIGLFVVGAVTLIVIVFLVFGSGDYFTQKYKYVIYFRSSVDGLSVGAPVKIRGVRIGTVTQITPVFDAKEEFSVEVIIETFGDVVRNISTYRVYDNEMMHINNLIDNGLRAQLNVQSLLTGQLYISVDYFPDTETVLTGFNDDYIEIPSIPPISEEIESKVKMTIESISKIDFDSISVSLLNTLDNLNELVSSLDLNETMNELNMSLRKSRDMMDNIVLNLDSATETFTETNRSLNTTLINANELIKSVDEMTNEQRFELITALREFTEAARSFRILSDYLQQHPESLIFGKD